jgi:hypothetical protein
MSLFEEKKPDNFTTESPIRAFTTFDVAGFYAVGKGFRPSMQHLARYLDAMRSKEGWELIQVLEAATNPTMLFRKSIPPLISIPDMSDDPAFLERLQQYRDAAAQPFASKAMTIQEARDPDLPEGCHP